MTQIMQITHHATQWARACAMVGMDPEKTRAETLLRRGIMDSLIFPDGTAVLLNEAQWQRLWGWLIREKLCERAGFFTLESVVYPGWQHE